jgi:hypothetical protein
MIQTIPILLSWISIGVRAMDSIMIFLKEAQPQAVWPGVLFAAGMLVMIVLMIKDVFRRPDK